MTEAPRALNPGIEQLMLRNQGTGEHGNMMAARNSSVFSNVTQESAAFPRFFPAQASQ